MGTSLKSGVLILAKDYNKIERLEAERDGAVQVKNSGRGVIRKGDAILDDLLTIDYKYTDASYGLSRKVWAKLTADSIHNRTVDKVLKVILGTEEEQKLRLWVVEDWFFKEMYKAWKEANDL